MRLLVIGIDGMDPDLVERWADELPFLATAARFSGGRITSVFPPDSVPAWASILTGAGEDEHGVSGHMDYLSQATPDESGGFAEQLRGRTFFDAVSATGRKVCVVNPFLAYPPWPVEGTMVSGPVGVAAPVQQAGSVPVALPEGTEPVIGGIEEFPGKRAIDGFIERTEADVVALRDYALSLMTAHEYDLGFVTFLQLDRVQHFLWRFTDSGDSTYPGQTAHEDSVLRFYRLLDSCCAHLAEKIGSAAVLVVSDHGHGRRCERVLNVNEVLRRAGLVRTRGGERPWATKGYWLQRLKIAVLDVAWRLGLEEQAFALARRLPNRRQLKTSSYLHERSSNLASASAIGGTNPFGGVDINADAARRVGVSVESVAEEVISALKAIRLRDGSSPLKWVAHRHEMYHGAHAADFPDVLFELEPSYGVGWDLYGAVEGPNVMHRRISGGHRRVGYLGVIGAQAAEAASGAKLTDIAPTVMRILGCEPASHMSGRPLTRD